MRAARARVTSNLGLLPGRLTGVPPVWDVVRHPGTWHRRAHCVGTRLDFTDVVGKQAARVRQRICATCPVFNDCAHETFVVLPGLAQDASYLAGMTSTERSMLAAMVTPADATRVAAVLVDAYESGPWRVAIRGRWPKTAKHAKYQITRRFTSHADAVEFVQQVVAFHGLRCRIERPTRSTATLYAEAAA